MRISSFTVSGVRQTEVERGAGINGAFGPGASSVAVNDSPDVGQADAGAFELIGAVQALEDSKQCVGIAHVEGDPVVANAEDGFLIIRGGADLDFVVRARAGVRQGVGDEVNDDLAKHDGITLDVVEFTDLPFDVAGS